MTGSSTRSLPGTERLFGLSVRGRAPGGIDTRRGTATRTITRGCTEMGKGRVLADLLAFLRHEKKYWLVPIVVVFVLFGLLIVFSQTSAVAPFIYTLF